jgi:hypothetical protein
MALADSLTTNELKDSTATEIEYLYFNQEARFKEWSKSGASPGLPDHLKIQHRDVGTGVDRVRQSNISLYKTEVGVYDTTKLAKSIASISLTVPEGNISVLTRAKDALACLGSLVFTNGNTTFVYDATAPGGSALLNGTI